MAKKLKKDFTHDEWAERLKNSSYQRAKREKEVLAKLKPKRVNGGTRLLKVECLHWNCGMLFRTAKTWTKTTLRCPRCHGAVQVHEENSPK